MIIVRENCPGQNVLLETGGEIVQGEGVLGIVSEGESDLGKTVRSSRLPRLSRPLILSSHFSTTLSVPKTCLFSWS